MRRGIHHLGFATRDYDATVEFYTKVIGWDIAWQDLIKAPDGGTLMKHVFFDTGDGSFVAFMEPRTGMPGVPESWDTGINAGLGLPQFVYHFAFWVDSLEDLEQLQSDLRDRGATVSEIIDHGWTSGIVVRDPNDLLLEFACTTRELTEDDKILKPRGAPVTRGHEGRPELRERDNQIILNLAADEAGGSAFDELQELQAGSVTDS